MIAIRAAKVALVAAVALFASLVTFGNHYSEQTDRPMSAFGPKQRLGISRARLKWTRFRFKENCCILA